MPPIDISFVEISSLALTSAEVPISTREVSVKTLPDEHPSLTDQNSQTVQSWPSTDPGMAHTMGMQGNGVSRNQHELDQTKETWKLIAKWLIPKLLEEDQGKSDSLAKSLATEGSTQLCKRRLDELKEQIYKGLKERGETEEHSRMLASRALPPEAQYGIEIACGLATIFLVCVGYYVYVSCRDSRRRRTVSGADHGQNTSRSWHGRASQTDPATDPGAYALDQWERLRPRLAHDATVRATEIQDPPTTYDPNNSNRM
jgi:hypothetical protein